MTQSTDQANSAIKVAALVVAGIYLYRRFTEGSAAELKASTTITPLGRFVVAWGVVFFGLSVLAGPFPAGAGDMALLLMLGSVLSNGVQISKDLNTGLQVTKKLPTATKGGRHPGVQTSPKPPIEVRSV